MRASWAGLSLASFVTVVVLASHLDQGSWSIALLVVAAFVWIGAGALLVIFARPAGLVLLTGATLLAQGVAPVVVEVTDAGPSAWVGRLATGVALTLVVLTLAVFPDGRFVPTWLRGVVVAFAAWQVATVVLGPFHGTADAVGGVVFFAGVLVPLGAQVHRYRRVSDQAMRTRTRWVVYGVAVAVLVELVVSLPYFVPTLSGDLIDAGSPYDRFQTAATTLALTAIPVCLVIAMLTAQLFDVDVVISRTLVYGGLTLAVTAGYLLMVWLIGLLVGGHGGPVPSLVAAAVVALLFNPLRVWLQRRARRWVYGQRAEPYDALTRLSRRLAETVSSDEVPGLLVETVRAALGVPWVALGVRSGEAFPVAAESGVATGREVSVPVLDRGEQVGLLVVGEDERRPLGPADRRLLADLTGHVGSAVRSIQLTEGLRQTAADLQVARERLVVAREEERRRIRRDLHDGLAPTLASAGISVATAADLVRDDPETSARILHGLQRNLQEAVGDIRTLVDGLRPPALDGLGLAHAIRERVEEMAPTTCATFEAPASLPPLPAAVEVAAYRICQEALMNVRRHADARHVTVRLSADDEALSLRVDDDGVGIRRVRSGGVGLDSMRERARELGGVCHVVTGDDGTSVQVRLPLRDGR